MQIVYALCVSVVFGLTVSNVLLIFVYISIKDGIITITVTNRVKDNLKKIEKHNSENRSWIMGITKFADLSR